MGLRGLRQNASDYIRRAEAGETFVVTVNGRPAAQLGPVGKPQWVEASALTGLWLHPLDVAAWEADMNEIDQEIRDPWES